MRRITKERSCFRITRMKVKKRPEHTDAIHQRLDQLRESKRIRAKRYRMRKKQREIDCEYNLQTLKTQNKSLREEVTQLRKEKKQMSANLTYYMTYFQQHSTQTYHQEFPTQTYHPVHHRYPVNNEAWISARWNIEAIEGYPSTEALLSIQEDNHSDNDDNDVINNQETNPNKIQDKKLATIMKNVL